ncbi:MAG: FtsX-like permease family protein [Gammaproteobacteria bacterium]|nr:MAG: FtsX-like permease family protein [Gammaproteobacteria bacterium]
MNPLLLRASLRYLSAHRAQSLLALLGIAVGVAAWVSVQSASSAAEDAFTLSSRQAFGIATHQLLPLDRRFDEAWYAELRRREPTAPAAPVLEGRVSLAGEHRTRSLAVLGIDPLAEAELRIEGVAAAGVGPELTALVGDPGAVVVSEALAETLGLAVDGMLRVTHAGREHELRVFAIADEALLPLGSDTLLLDIAGAQRVLDSAGELSRVDLVLSTAQAARLAAWQPEALELVATVARSQAVTDMTRAYRLNLLALSLLTLLVGLLLVYSTMTHLVAQREVLFARLRALGLDAAAVRGLVLREALLLGLAGGLVGALAGTLLARWLVRLVAANISDLYFRVEVQTLAPQPGVMLVGLALGLLAALAGGLAPAVQAANRLAARTRRLWLELGLSAVLATGGAVVLLGFDGLVAGFAGLFLVAVAGVLLVPAALETVVAIVGRLPVIREGLLARMTLRDSVAGLVRTRVALAGLALAVATVIALDLMVANFRDSVATWMDDSVAGEFVISVDSAMHPDVREAPLLAAREAVLALADVEAVVATRFLRLRDGADTLLLRAADHPQGVPGLVRGSAGDAFETGEGVLISEPLAMRRGLEVGDRLRLAFPAGPVSLPVLGVYRDYLSDRGVVLMSMPGLARWSGDDRPGSLGVLTARPEALRPQLEALLEAYPGLLLSEAATLRERTLEIFDRTFAVTHVLKVLVAAAAVLGMLGALLAWLLDRRPLRRTLRALGLGVPALRRQAVLETGALGLATALVAVPLGMVLAALLVFVINRRAFGWSMQFEILAWPLVQGALLAVATALVAGALAAASIRAASGRAQAPRPTLAGLVMLLAGVGLAGCSPSGPAGEPEALNVAGLLAGDAGTERHALVTGPRTFVFPDDHGEHPDYRLEWWYLTGVLRDAEDRRFGMQYTQFRFSLRPRPEDLPETVPARDWESRQVYMAHLALTHVDAGEHRHAERFARPGGGLAGVRAAPFNAWIQDWALASTAEEFLPLALTAAGEDFALRLEFAPGRGPVLHGDAGYSRKGRDPGNASHYFSFTRLPTTGELYWDDARIEVSGLSWMDREWGSSVLDPDVVGWDWLSLSLADGRDLMLFQLREVEGGTAPFSAGTVVNPDGRLARKHHGDFEMTPVEHWTSPVTGSRYPVAWQVTVPRAALEFRLRAVLPAQEMRTRVRYWEGLVEALDDQGNRLGEGYLEMTGY